MFSKKLNCTAVALETSLTRCADPILPFEFPCRLAPPLLSSKHFVSRAVEDANFLAAARTSFTCKPNSCWKSNSDSSIRLSMHICRNTDSHTKRGMVFLSTDSSLSEECFVAARWPSSNAALSVLDLAGECKIAKNGESGIAGRTRARQNCRVNAYWIAGQCMHHAKNNESGMC